MSGSPTHDRSMPHRTAATLVAVTLAIAVAIAPAACGSSDDAPPPAASDGGAGGGGSVDAHHDSVFPLDHDASGDGDTAASNDAAADVVVDPIRYSNPVYAADFPDPFVLRTGDAYIAFATNADGSNIQTARSSNLATWVKGADALPALPPWAAKSKGLTWAPSVLARGASFVLYYTTRDAASGFQCISRATSTAPQGPYVDTSLQPLLCQVAGADAFCGSIDPSPFVDATGQAYLLWKSDENSSACRTAPRLFAQALTDDGVSLVGSPVVLLTRDQSWEGEIIEGPSMVAHDGIYYLFYSANWYNGPDYAIGYAKCTTASGPCTKVTVDRGAGSAPIVRSAGTALGPGGQEFFTDTRNRTWMSYHAWTSPLSSYASGGLRSMRIDPIDFANGAPVLSAPTTGPTMY